MKMRAPVTAILSLLLLCAPIAYAANADLGSAAKTGAAELESAGPLAFGPDGILFVGDTKAAAIYAIDTGDRKGATKAGALNLEGVTAKLAALAGTTEDGIRINDLAVNPLSKKAYLSASRGQGDNARPAIFTVSPNGDIDLLSLSKVRYARATLTDVPDHSAKDRRDRSLRVESITDLAYVDGQLLVTGLSNEEFSSRLRSLEFPFQQIAPGTTIEIYHGSHGRWETNAPIRAFATYDIGTAPHVLAAYTCTPLVKFSLEELAMADRVTGTTVAELGNRNRPLDMVVYTQGGRDYLLTSNSARGVMKIDLAEAEKTAAITDRVPDKAGLAYETLTDLEGVVQLDRYDKDHALILIAGDSGQDLRTIPLP